MAARIIKKIPKGKTGKSVLDSYVRFTPKSLYLNNGAMQMIPGVDFVQMSIDVPGHVLCVIPASCSSDYSFKLSSVNETKHARRIETNNALLSLLDAGFPRGMIGKRLPVMKGLDGSLIVDLRPQIPLGVQEVGNG